MAEDLLDIISMLSFMRGELENYVCTLPELFCRCSRNCRGKAALFCTELSIVLTAAEDNVDFSTMWSRLLIGSFKELNAEDCDALSRLGDILGRYDLETQLIAISAAEKSLEKSYHALKNSLPDKCRLCTGYIFLGCTMLMILLI